MSVLQPGQLQGPFQNPTENSDKFIDIVLYVAGRSISDYQGLFDGSSQVSIVLLQLLQAWGHSTI